MCRRGFDQIGCRVSFTIGLIHYDIVDGGGGAPDVGDPLVVAEFASLGRQAGDSEAGGVGEGSSPVTVYYPRSS